MNRLTVSLQHSILTLYERGWSARRIARELGVHRETVGRYLRAKPAIPTTGLPEGAESKAAISTTGSASGAEPKPAISTAGFRAGRRSTCDPYLARIEADLDRGLSLRRIHQDLVSEQAGPISYEALKRAARKLAADRPLPFRRLETAPGEELQVDFGRGAWVLEEGRKRRPHLFRCVLSYEAIKQDRDVRYVSIFDLVGELLQNEALQDKDRLLRQYLKPDLLIIDDMGLKQLPKHSGEYLLELIVRRHENKSTLMTSNRPLEDWGKLLHDVPTAAAILDRFLHHARVVVFSGRSYRLKDSAFAAPADQNRTG